MDIEIRKYLKIALRWWWLLLVSVAVPMAVSYYFASQQPDFYQAKATLMVGSSLENPNPDPGQINLSNTLAAAYAELVRQGPVTEAVIERLGLERTPEQLAAQIGTAVRSGAYLLEIWVTDTNPEAAAVIANALADELIRRSPASGGSDPAQQEFVRSQLEELQAKIGNVNGQINELTASLADLTSAAEIQDAQDRIAALDEVGSLYQAAYGGLLGVYRAESPNVLSLFDPAVAPQWPMPKKTKLIVALSGAAGLGLALGATFLIEYMDTSLRWEGDGVQFILELPVLGAIPQVSKKKAVLSGNPLGPVAQGVRTARTNVFLTRPDRPFETLLLTSPSDSEGKSFVLAHLALVLAAAGKRVIAVDGDMRSPALHEFFDRPNVHGLADVLDDQQVDDEDAFSVPLQETDFDNLHLLSAGRSPADPTGLLTSPRFPSLLEFLRDRADVILIDSPPVLGPPDATVLATLVEGTILVASVGLTRREWIQQASDRLCGRQEVNLLGVVVNRIKARGDLYGYSAGPKARESKLAGKSPDGAPLRLGEAASYLGISKDRVRDWCKSGRLPGERRGLWWRVDPDGLRRIAEGTWDDGDPSAVIDEA